MNETANTFGNWSINAISLPPVGATLSVEVPGVAQIVGMGRDHQGAPVVMFQHMPKGPGSTQLSVSRVILGAELPTRQDLYFDHINPDGVAELPVPWDVVGVVNETSPSHVVLSQETYKGSQGE